MSGPPYDPARLRQVAGEIVTAARELAARAWTPATSMASETHDNEATLRSSVGGLIIRQKEPRNLKAPFAQADSYLTPTEQLYTVFGAAWTGETEVTAVEVSTDGETWADAQFLDAARRHAWRRWKCDWRTQQAGPTHSVDAGHRCETVTSSRVSMTRATALT